jgi:D-amino-acid dehydrogenase
LWQKPPLTDPTLNATAPIPGARDLPHAQAWCGLGPATPSNVPYLRRSAIPDFFLGTGHGNLGWIHASGSGHAIADIVCGRRPALEFAFTGI